MACRSLKQSTEAPTCPICKSSVQWKITPEIKEVACEFTKCVPTQRKLCPDLADQLSATNQLYFGKSEADKVWPNWFDRLLTEVVSGLRAENKIHIV